MFTDLEKKRQSSAIFLSLKGKTRETILAKIKQTDTSKDGVDFITASLDRLYVKNESDSAIWLILI